MISTKLVYVIAGICIASAVAGKTVNLPKGFKICSRNDPKLMDCMKEAAKIDADLLANGYPELDLPPGNPLHLDHMNFSIGEEGSPVSFTVTLTDIVGSYEIIAFDEFKLDREKKEISLVERLKFLTINATHSSKGKLFIGQINGKGKCTASLEEPTFMAHMNYAIQKRDGEDYIHIDSLKLKISSKKIHGYFENLIGRDKTVNDSINKAINENWKTVFGPIHPKVEEEMGKILAERLNLFFDKVTHDQLFPE